jgi:peptide chain release factor 2
MEDPSLWDDPEKARALIKKAADLKVWVLPYQDVKTRFDSVKTLLPEAVEMEEGSFVLELLSELNRIEEDIQELELRKMLSGEMDNKNCFLNINAGAGGTEACDWALMLSRMYQRWIAKRGWKLEILDTVEGDVAGIKSMTMKIVGPFAYGLCKAERGVHRLVRISPFDSNAKRHTSFASVDVSPEIDDDIEVTIRPEDIRVDTYRASGAGGQHVNKTDSAVRMTHAPSGIVVSCQSERSQIQNRETCLKLLRAKLYEQEVLQRESKVKELSGEKKEIAWGSQIRNYVFQPYTLVKDTRTKYETSQVEDVMNGNLDPFVNAYLKEFG